MAYIVKLPKLGLEMEEGELIKWYATQGDAVETGQVIAEVESDKTVSEIEAREDGVIKRIYIDSESRISVGTPLAIIAEKGEDIENLEEDVAEKIDGTQNANKSTKIQDSKHKAEPKGKFEPQENDEKIKATPKAKKRAKDRNINLRNIQGTGPKGAITADDVGEVVQKEVSSPTVQKERPLDGMRKTIANKLGESYRNAIHVTLHRDIDAEEILSAATVADSVFDVDISMMDVLLVAISETLDEHPEFNATFENGIHRMHDVINICVAVDINEGLIAPAIEEAGDKSIKEIAGSRRDWIERARTGDYTMEDLQGGTFTVSNLGVFGVNAFNPIINPPQIAILGVDAINQRPTPDGSGVNFKRYFGVDLSFDHRVVDGADAARFLSSLVEKVEDPWQVLPDKVSSADESDREVQLPDRDVTALTNGGMSGTVTAGSFEFKYDEPPDIGGGGTAPSPVDHFLGALAACLSVSVGVQASKHKVDPAAVQVDVSANPKRSKVESIEIAVTVDADIEDDKLERIVGLGERGCYVARLLRDDLTLETTWKRA